MAGHHPTILSARSGAWAECSCGWLGTVVDGPKTASATWAEHVRSVCCTREER